MKLLKHLLTTVLLLCAIIVNAQSVVKVGELFYKINDESKTAEVLGLDYELNVPEEPGMSGVYINETFASGFGVFSTEETVGNYPWIIDYSTAKATSYVDGANNAATSWLISSPVDFTNETEAYVTFDYIIRYYESGKVANNHSLLISADYAGNAAEATWVDLPYNAVEGSDWVTFYNASVNIPAEFMGKANITFALRYTAVSKSSTWEVKNFKVSRGKVEVVGPEEISEYTVTGALAAYTGVAKPAVVKGYIVGTVTGYLYTEGCVFSSTADVKANLLIADNTDETDYNNCMPVQLPSGAVRNALNLVDNPGNYKKLVTLTGSLERYFGVAGLKSVSKYAIDGVTPDQSETPDQPEIGEALFAETFTSSLGEFTTQQTVGNFAWKFEEYNGKGYANVSGYDGSSQDAESWLISPAINFSGINAAYISFDYVINKGDASLAAANHKVVVTDNFTGDVATTSWTEVAFGAYNDSTWGFKSTGNIALPEVIMNKPSVVVAFKYNSTTANSSTWEMNNLVIAAGAGETPDQPETPDTPDEPEEPDTPAVPACENLLANGSFEEWNDSTPTDWGKDGSNATAHNATITQSTEAYEGCYAVVVNGDAKGNKRLASKCYRLPAGTYTYTIYVKTNGSDAGHCRIGYVPIADGKSGSYVYEDAVASAVTEYWTTRTMEFTLTEETTIALVVMNNKTGNGVSFLVDNATLVKNGESAGIAVVKSPMNNIDTSSTTIDSITIPESIDVNGCRYIVTSIGDAAFSGCINLKSVIIEGNVADIGSYAFNNCFGLTNIVIPGSVADIGSYSFNGCSGLKYVEILNGVKSIGSYAFSGCSSVETLYISNTIETIGDYAFEGCNRILEIKIGSKYAITASENIFSNDTYNNACLYVPAGRKFAYERTVPWNNFYIMDMDFTRIEVVGSEKGVMEEVYDLRGCMVDNPKNGIYITKGRKVLVK